MQGRVITLPLVRIIYLWWCYLGQVSTGAQNICDATYLVRPALTRSQSERWTVVRSLAVSVAASRALRRHWKRAA